jgi:hypothetical protein
MFVTVSLRSSTVEGSKVSNYHACRGSTMVEHSAHNYKVEASNPTAATRSLKMWKDSDKHTSLLHCIIYYNSKKLYKTGPSSSNHY